MRLRRLGWMAAVVAFVGLDTARVSNMWTRALMMQGRRLEAPSTWLAKHRTTKRPQHRPSGSLQRHLKARQGLRAAQELSQMLTESFAQARRAATPPAHPLSPTNKRHRQRLL